MVIRRLQTVSSLAISNTLRCSRANSSRSFFLAESKGAMISTNSGTTSTSSRMRASKPSFPTMPTRRPKLRSKPRMSFSMAIAFSCSSLRAVSRARRFWLVSVFTCTGRNRLTRIICAMPRASLRSVLFTCALRKASRAGSRCKSPESLLPPVR